MILGLGDYSKSTNQFIENFYLKNNDFSNTWTRYIYFDILEFLSFSFLISPIDVLSILLTFSKNQIFALLIIYFYLLHISFISYLIFILPSYFFSFFRWSLVLDVYIFPFFCANFSICVFLHVPLSTALAASNTFC